MYTTHDMTILIYITDLCNMKCPYCYNNFPRNNREINSNILLNYFDDMFSKTNRCQNILLIGGEPTLYSELFCFI
jgi:sulfatase maturation enzyme AslB (radical SAM superfamily)